MPVIALRSGQVVLSGGDLGQALSSQIVLGADNQAINVAGSQLKLRFTPSSGVFRGTAVNPTTGKTLSLSGAVLQQSASGSGFFRSVDQIGHTYVGP